MSSSKQVPTPLCCFYGYSMLAWITYMTRFSVHVCLLVHTTWFHFTYSLDCFLKTLNLHVQILELAPRQTPLLWTRLISESRQPSSRSIQIALSCLAREIPLVARDHLLYCTYLVNLYFASFVIYYSYKYWITLCDKFIFVLFCWNI